MPPAAAFDIARAEAAEWPVIEQEQNERHRNQHRFAHEAEREEEEDEEIAAERFAPDVARISPESQHEEKAAQHVLPLRHPGDGFDPQGMDGKKRSDQT